MNPQGPHTEAKPWRETAHNPGSIPAVGGQRDGSESGTKQRGAAMDRQANYNFP